MRDSDGLRATVVLFGELDGDLDFFDGLFDDLPCNKVSDETHAATSTPRITTMGPPRPPLPVTLTVTGDRRQRRRIALGDHIDPCGWKNVAKSQKHAREAAESENAQLRRLVASHERAVAKMAKLMQRAVALSSPQIVRQPAGECVAQFMGPPTDLVQITRSLDAIACHANHLDLPPPVFAASAPQLQICGLENRIVRAKAGDVIESTLDVAWVLPFAVDAITSAMVAHSIHFVTGKQVPKCETVYESPECTVVQAITTPRQKYGQRFTKHGRIATRREPARPDGSQLVVVDTLGAIYVDATLVATIETDSCILVRNVPSHDNAARGPVSQVHRRRRFRVQPTASATETPAARARWINALTTKKTRKTERHVDKLSQAIESLLLDAPTRP